MTMNERNAETFKDLVAALEQEECEQQAGERADASQSKGLAGFSPEFCLDKTVVTEVKQICSLADRMFLKFIHAIVGHRQLPKRAYHFKSSVLV